MPGGWPSGWDVYSVVFLSALLALGVPALFAALSWLVARARPGLTVKRDEAWALPLKEVSAGALGRKMNTRFFLGANVVLNLIAMGLALIPCVGALAAAQGTPFAMLALVPIVSLAGFASVGLLYSSRKGDLDWLKTFRDREVDFE